MTTQQTKDFLFEIGTEELPAKHLLPLKHAFQVGIVESLGKANLTYQGEVSVFVTPRRLAVFVPKLAIMQPDQLLERKGPALSAAFDAEGKATKACEGFAKSMGLAVDELERRETPEGVWLYAKKTIPGQPAEKLLPDIVKAALAKLPIPKPMRWGNHTEAFLRPVRWVVMLFGGQVIPASFFGLEASHTTYGHRFMAPHAIMIDNPKDYEEILYRDGKVIADFDARKNHIHEELMRAAAAIKGTVKESSGLLEEVTGLVEWPVVLQADFNSRFLDVPTNALISSMESHQKCFAIFDQQGKLMPHFLTVSNLISKDPKQVIAGNEKVMTARLSDAEFFYQQDLKIPLRNHLADLDKVIFQAQLGSLAVKSQAIADLAAYVAVQLNVSTEDAREAGLLSKCDLRTQMVGEFPELQGEIGMIYAKAQGIKANIADALYQQYLPRFAGDEVPKSPVGIAVALADRLLNLVGIIGVGQLPTGDKDPFALRRAALGVVRIIFENALGQLALRDLLIQAQAIWEKLGANFTQSDTVELVFNFIIERFRNLYLEQGYTPQALQAVLQFGLDNLSDIDLRVRALTAFQQMPEASVLAAANKRVNNLFQKEKLDATDLGQPDANLFTEKAEHDLYNALAVLQAKAQPLLDAKQYAEALQLLASIKNTVDDFFNHVMILVGDAKIRHNRLALLAQLRNLLSAVADISCLST